MFTRQRAAALGAFLAGGVLVGGITFAGVAHGAGTTTTATGQSDAQYTARFAWAQSISNDNIETTLSIPPDKRLTITGALAVSYEGVPCVVSATLSGTPETYTIEPNPDSTVVVTATGATVGPDFVPVSLDSASVKCLYGSTLVGYLTPTPQPRSRITGVMPQPGDEPRPGVGVPCGAVFRA